jgi:hypothetical protein
MRYQTQPVALPPTPKGEFKSPFRDLGLALVFLFLLPLGLGLHGTLFAQEIVVNTMADEGQEVPLKRDTVTSIVSFSAKQVQDTAYLCWKMQDMRNKGVFILYRSGDGKNFSVIATKNVFGVPLKTPVAHYFKDASYGGGTKYYRLVYISSANEYLISEKIMVQGGAPALKGETITQQ